MSDAALIFGAFHFIRPLILLALPVVALIWWRLRRGGQQDRLPNGVIAPHLKAALTVGAAARRRILPVDGAALALVLAILGAAGPTWSRSVDPFAAQSAPAVIVLKVTPSMLAEDVAPSRLERGKQKIRDFLDLRAGARSALVAYAGTAHGVVPMTGDPGVMLPYLEGLEPDVMPVEGADAGAALALAEQLLAQEDAPGGILFVADTVDPADTAALSAGDGAVAVLAMLPAGLRDRGLDGLAVPVVPVTPDAGDLQQLDRQLNAAFRQAQLENTSQPWEDRAWWLAWPLAFLVLIWFRRGWTIRWGAALLLCTGLGIPQPASADGLADWFLTPDQQGQIAMNRKNFGPAAEAFIDPLWRGYAMYRNGQYGDAVEVLNRVETAQAAFIQGMAHIKSRGYRDAVRAFETTLLRDPEYPDAAENLAVAQRIVEYVESAREQSDTGEDTGIGADDIVFDNEEARGAETDIDEDPGSGDELLTAAQWMNTVDTRTGDFLRQRFALEAAAARSGAAEPDENAQQGGSE
jgi:Ca-activated chloride channel family protein